LGVTANDDRARGNGQEKDDDDAYNTGGDETMRCDRLTRKTASRRHHDTHHDTDGRKAGGAVAVYDLTQHADPCPPARFQSGKGRGCVLDTHRPSFKSTDDIVHWCALMCTKSPIASGLWASAYAHGWSLGLGDLKSGGFSMDLEAKTVTLDHYALTPSGLARSGYFRNALLCNIARALRDIWHEDRQTPQDGLLAPEDVLMIERVRAADCDTVAVLIGWEWRGAGYADLWRHLIGSEEGDMALIFSHVLERDPSSLFNRSALAYAFRQWYVDDARVNAVDHETLESLDDAMIKGDQTARPSFGTRRVKGAMIEALSTLPDGNIYLSGLGDTVRRDPFFAGLNDEINQVHLFHLVYDTQVVMVQNVPFRDAKLARLIFPDNQTVL
jgi:hypothetical protein